MYNSLEIKHWQSTLCKTTENLLETARQKYPNSKIQLEILTRQIGNLKREQYELKSLGMN